MHQSSCFVHYYFFKNWIVSQLSFRPPLVSADKKWTLVFVKFSAKDASCINIKNQEVRKSWGFQNSEVWMILGQVMAIQRKKKFPQIILIEDLEKESQNIVFWKSYNLASNHANWGCFGILRASSWLWEQGFLKLMHLGGWGIHESGEFSS